MRCRRARAAIPDRRVGKLSPGAREELRLHLRSCPGCAEEARIEGALAADLALLREEVPPRVDAVRRVVSGVSALGRVSREDVSMRQLGWAAAATTGVGLALLASAALLAPAALGQVREGKALAEGLVSVLAGLGRSLGLLLAVAAKLVRFALEGLGSMASLLGAMEPLARAGADWAVVAMAAVTALVVGRDLWRGAPARARKES